MLRGIGGSHLEEDGHGCNDPPLPQGGAQAVKVVGVVGVDLHLPKKESLSGEGSGAGSRSERLACIINGF